MVVVEPTADATADFAETTIEKIFLDKVEKVKEIEQELGQEEQDIPEVSPSPVTSSTQVKSATDSVKSSISVGKTPVDIPLAKSGTSIRSESLPAAKSVISVKSQASQAKDTSSAMSVKTTKSAVSTKSSLSSKSTARATSPVKSATSVKSVVPVSSITSVTKSVSTTKSTASAKSASPVKSALSAVSASLAKSVTSVKSALSTKSKRSAISVTSAKSSPVKPSTSVKSVTSVKTEMTQSKLTATSVTQADVSLSNAPSVHLVTGDAPPCDDSVKSEGSVAPSTSQISAKSVVQSNCSKTSLEQPTPSEEPVLSKSSLSISKSVASVTKSATSVSKSAAFVSKSATSVTQADVSLSNALSVHSATGEAPPCGDSVKSEGSVAPSTSQISAKSVVQSKSERSVNSVRLDAVNTPELTAVTPEEDEESAVAPIETAPSIRSASPL